MELATYTFPPESVYCEPGDYLLCKMPDGKSVVYRVEDLLLVKRLVRFGTEPSDLVLEEHLLDSVAPAYLGEIHLLLTMFEPSFDAEDAAIDAIRSHQLTETAKGLLRSARDFAKSHCARAQVVQP